MGAWVELHLHYDSDDTDAKPNCGHLKNQKQAVTGGPYAYRGRVPIAELSFLTNDVIRRSGAAQGK